MNFFSWKTVPFVRFILPLIFGIITAVFTELPVWIAAILMFFGAAGLLVTLKTMQIKRRIILEKWSYLFIAALIFGLGIWLVDMNTSLDRNDHFSKQHKATFLRATVTESIQEKNKSFKSILLVHEALVDSTWIPCSGNLLVYLQKDEEAQSLEIADELILPAEFKNVNAPRNPGEFNYKTFLSFRDIYHQQYLMSGHWRKEGSRWTPRKQSERWRIALRRLIGEVGMGQKEEAIASALLLGKKDELDPQLLQSYASAGAMHVLAVSGLHVGIIFFILQVSLSWMKHFKRSALLKAVILILCLWIYAFITGLSPSVVRAAAMFSAMALAKGIGRKSSIYNTVASSAFILLAFNPFYIMEVGFQLSYLAVLGIIYLFPKVYDLLYFPSWLPDKIWQISCVSIAAQLATFPLGLLYFHQFPTYFLLSNLLVIPAAFVILYIGFIFILFSWIPFLGEAIGEALAWSIWLLNQSVSWVESLPNSLIQGIDISVAEALLVYGVTISGILAFLHYKMKTFVLGLTIMAGLMVWQVFEWQSLKRHTHMVVYDILGESVVNVLSSTQNLVFCSSAIAENSSKQQFHFRNNWNRHGAPEPEFIVDSLSNLKGELIKGLYLLEGKSVMLVNEKKDIEQIGGRITVDYLVLSFHKGLNMDDLLERVEPAVLILDGSIRGKTIERLRNKSEGVRTHVVNEDGYFSTRL